MKILDSELLAEAVRRMVDVVQPERIYLYGSHAYGTPHEDSDVDLLVLVEASEQPAHVRVRPVYRALRGLLFPAEIKMVTRQEFERHLLWTVSIERDAVEKGKLVYERA